MSNHQQSILSSQSGSWKVNLTLDKILVSRVLEGRQPSTVSSLLLGTTGAAFSDPDAVF